MLALKCCINQNLPHGLGDSGIYCIIRPCSPPKKYIFIVGRKEHDSLLVAYDILVISLPCFFFQKRRYELCVSFHEIPRSSRKLTRASLSSTFPNNFIQQVNCPTSIASKNIGTLILHRQAATTMLVTK